MPNIHSPASNVLVKVLEGGQTATHTSAALDTNGFTRLMFVIVGTTAATSTVDLKVQECATSGGFYTDVPGAAITEIAASQTNEDLLIELNLEKRLRYLKTVGTITGTVSYSVNAHLFNPRNAAVTQDNAPVSVM